jgi:hypothetical protein
LHLIGLDCVVADFSTLSRRRLRRNRADGADWFRHVLTILGKSPCIPSRDYCNGNKESGALISL